jgi:very-short-patch-repair endonuclease
MMWRVCLAMREEPATRAVARLAARQHGVISLGRLRSTGLSRQAISRQVMAGRLHRIHRGVYAVGHRSLSPHGHWLAAVLACGEGAVLSHQSAAGLWALLPAVSSPAHVTIPLRSGRRSRRGIIVHRSARLASANRTIRASIPVTSLARTLADLRRTASKADYRRALREAELRGYEPPSGDALCTRSELEDAFLRLCRRHGLPPPEVNVPIGPFIVDFLWRADRLVVETDGYRFHRGKTAFEDDRERDLELARLGFHVLRLSHRQVTGEPSEVASAVRRCLEQRLPDA